MSKAQFIGSPVRVSFAAKDKLADVTHQGGIDVLFTCRDVRGEDEQGEKLEGSEQAGLWAGP